MRDSAVVVMAAPGVLGTRHHLIGDSVGTGEPWGATGVQVAKLTCLFSGRQVCSGVWELCGSCLCR